MDCMYEQGEKCSPKVGLMRITALEDGDFLTMAIKN